MTKNRRGLEWRPRLRFEVYFLRENMLLQAFQYNPLDLCWVASSEGPSLRSQLRLCGVQKWERPYLELGPLHDRGVSR